jgi:hypothetical protein
MMGATSHCVQADETQENHKTKGLTLPKQMSIFLGMATLLQKIQTKLEARKQAAIRLAVEMATAKAQAEYDRDLEAAKRTVSLLDDEELELTPIQASASGIPQIPKLVVIPHRGWKSQTIREAVLTMKGQFTVEDVLEVIEKNNTLPEPIAHVTASGFLSEWADREDGLVLIAERGAGRRPTIFRRRG